ncbi:MAG: filamentous hemagglutinin N-terminal domain-containing protein [Candidatus Gastranaerophilales bacterium]|nr:filamentous hemagglutinin N-terminal domain-containing protein [Candidatus Gastranaerophilales bacterium]
MKRMSSLFKKMAIAGLLLASCANVMLPAMAATPDTTLTSSGEVFSGTASGYGAYVNSMSNATITTNNVNANVTTTGNGSVLNWQYLNVASGKSLNYTFTADGQVSLNTVVTGMSKFAGNLTTSGSAGRLIISNPNGILFENGSYTNANALILTTKDVNWDGNLNGQISLINNNSTGTITIGQGNLSNMAVIHVADDINIVAPNIVVNGASIKTDIGSDGNLLTTSKGGDIRLITTDGVTFYAKHAIPESGEKFATTVDPSNTASFGDITIKKATLAVENNSTGKVYLVAHRNINVSDASSLANSIASAGNFIKIKNSNVTSSDLTAKKRVGLANNSRLENSTVLSTESDVDIDASTVKNSSINAKTYINAYNGSLINNSSLFAEVYLNLWASTASLCDLKSGSTFNSTNSVIDNSKITSGYNINIYDGSTLKNSIATAKNNVSLSEAKLENSNVNADKVFGAYHDSEIKNSFINAGSGIKLTDSEIKLSNLRTQGSLITNNAVIKNSIILTDNYISLTNGSKLTNSEAFTKNNFNVVSSSKVSGSIVSAVNDINLYKSSVEKSILYTRNDLNIKDSSIDKSFVYVRKDVNKNNANITRTLILPLY